LEEPPAASVDMPDPEPSQDLQADQPIQPRSTVVANFKSPAKARGRSPKGRAKALAKMPGMGLGVAGAKEQAREALSAAQARATGQAQRAKTPPKAVTPAEAIPATATPSSIDLPLVVEPDAEGEGPLEGGPLMNDRPSTRAEQAMDDEVVVQAYTSTSGRGRSRRERRRRQNDQGFKPITSRPSTTEEPPDVELPEDIDVPVEDVPTDGALNAETPAIETPPQLDPTPAVQEVPLDPADDSSWLGPRHVRVLIASAVARRHGWLVEHPGAVEIHGLLLSKISIPLEVKGATVAGQHFWEQQQHIRVGDLLVGIDSDDVSQGDVGSTVSRLRRSPRVLTFCRSIVNHLRVVREQLHAACGSGLPVATPWAQPTRDVLPPQPVPEGVRAVFVRANSPVDLHLKVPSAGLPPAVVALVGTRAGFWKDHGVIAGDFLVKANGIALSGHSLEHVHSMLQQRPLHLLFQSQNSFYKDLGHFGLSAATLASVPQHQSQHQLQPQQLRPQQLRLQQQQQQQHQPDSTFSMHQVSATYRACLNDSLKEQAEANAKIIDEQARCRERAMHVAWKAHKDVLQQREELLLQEQQKAQDRVATLLSQDVSATPQLLTNLEGAVARTQQLEAAARGALESVVRRRFEDALRGASEAVEAASLGSGVNDAMRIMEDQRSLGATW